MEGDESIIRFSLASVPEAQRRDTLTEVFGRGVVNMEFTPLSERQRFEFEMRFLPNVILAWGRNSPHRGTTGHDRSLENDDLMMSWASRRVSGRMIQRGREIGGDGSGAFVTCAEPMVGETGGDFHFVNVRIAHASLRPLLANPEEMLMRPVPPSSEAFRMLKRYLGVLRSQGKLRMPEVAQAAALHIADLVALAVGATREGTELAVERGLAAARIATVKAWTLERLSNPALSVTDAASAHRISPRYVQLLFATEGTSFTAWMRGQRLALARRWLSDPAQSHRTIACIAFDCGFSDLSWFNRAYRGAYGETPGDTRHDASRTRH